MASLLSSDSGELRASDEERDVALAELRHRFSEGRISHDTFLARMDAVLLAKYRGEVRSQLADLPQAAAGEPEPDRRRTRHPVHLIAGWRHRIGSAVAALAGGYRHEPPPLVLPSSTRQRFTIGRELACDFTLANLSVSRWHAKLHYEDGCWLLSDLGSTNGTRLNGWRVTTGVPLAVGDRVSFGSVTFVIASRAAG